MFKLIFMMIGLAPGFAVGVWWAHHNPDAAAQLSAAEEKKFLEEQLAVTQKIQAKLDQLSNKTTAKPAGSGFLSAQQAAPVTSSDVNDVKADTKKQEEELRAHLNALK